MKTTTRETMRIASVLAQENVATFAFAQLKTTHKRAAKRWETMRAGRVARSLFWEFDGVLFAATANHPYDENAESLADYAWENGKWEKLS